MLTTLNFPSFLRPGISVEKHAIAADTPLVPVVVECPAPEGKTLHSAYIVRHTKGGRSLV